MSSVQSRKDEILAKKARLAELKRQREIRQKEFSSTRQSIGDASEVCPPQKLSRIKPYLTSRQASTRISTPWP